MMRSLLKRTGVPLYLVLCSAGSALAIRNVFRDAHKTRFINKSEFMNVPKVGGFARIDERSHSSSVLPTRKRVRIALLKSELHLGAARRVMSW